MDIILRVTKNRPYYISVTHKIPISCPVVCKDNMSLLSGSIEWHKFLGVIAFPVELKIKNKMMRKDYCKK